jgi:hypothetical protein
MFLPKFSPRFGFKYIKQGSKVVVGMSSGLLAYYALLLFQYNILMARFFPPEFLI